MPEVAVRATACTCVHARGVHRRGNGRCLVAECPCLYGPAAKLSPNLPKAIRSRIGVSERTKLERKLWEKIELAGLPMPELEYRFARPRMFRADGFYAPDLLIEVEGGIWAANPGRHNRGSGFQTDAEKYNLAAILGFRVLRFTERMIKSGEAVETINRALTPAPKTETRACQLK